MWCTYAILLKYIQETKRFIHVNNSGVICKYIRAQEYTDKQTITLGLQHFHFVYM